ncbi:MAG: indolepyruvate ferredoxin oxidoreductase subunit alpha [Anaerolineales bacterium]|nr:indolepyruvate ferredoxin oxidoreductase subunit alpha [Anaerolineales bacterium]
MALKLAEKMLIHGDEALAVAMLDARVALGAGYPGTPSSEILETFSQIGGRGEWAPNEKVALEVALGAAFGGARAVAAMKHVGLNVAADPFFTAAYTGTAGALVVVSADDPGMASSQNEQDNRRYAEAAGAPMLEPADAQETYDFFFTALEIAERWRIPVLFRMTTRVCHSKSVVVRRGAPLPPPAYGFEHDRRGRVMVPGNARPAHRRLRAKLAEIAEWNEESGPNLEISGSRDLGIITSGVSFLHVREAAPEASVLKLGMTYPFPFRKIRAFAAGLKQIVVIEEGDPFLTTAIRANGLPAEGKAEMYRFGELSVERVRRILAGDASPEPAPPPGKPPQFCVGCPHRRTFEILGKMDLIVAGDIGCYTLGVLPPFNAMDSCVCMGASIGVGLGLRHVLPEDQARRVVSVIGDSTFAHSGLTGLAEMAYNPPKTGHVLLILDNGTTAMTGLQDHPGTGYTLGECATTRMDFEAVGRAMGMHKVHTVTQKDSAEDFERLLRDSLASNDLTLIVVRNPCLLAAKKLRARGRAAAEPPAAG